MKIKEKITALTLTFSIILLSGCDMQITDSSDANQSNHIISGTSSDENFENSQQPDGKNDSTNISDDSNAGNISINELIQEMTKIDENTLLARSDGPIMLIDTKSYKVIKESSVWKIWRCIFRKSITAL